MRIKYITYVLGRARLFSNFLKCSISRIYLKVENCKFSIQKNVKELKLSVPHGASQVALAVKNLPAKQES